MKTDLLTLLQWILDYSVLLSAQLIVLLALRPFIRRLMGATAVYRLWLLPVVWLPFYFITWSPDRVQQWLEALPGAGVAGSMTEGLLIPAVADLQFNLPLPDIPALNPGASAQIGLWVWLAAIWLAVAFALLLREACRIVRFADYVGFTARPVPANEANMIRGNSTLCADLPLVYLKDIESPALYGFLRPVLLLPENFLSRFDADQRHIMLSHEAIHHQRRDNFWNLAACLARILFWFNPLVHVAHHYYRLDQEVSCDALALVRCNAKQARQYARTLVASVAPGNDIRHPPIIAAWENPAQLRERITFIGHHLGHSRSRTSAILCFAVLVLSGGVLTSCASGSSEPVITVEEIEGGALNGRQPPVAAGNSNTLSRRVFNLINEIMVLRDEGDLDGARRKLDEVKALAEAQRLNPREQFVMWQFDANLHQLAENYPGAVNAYENLLRLDNLEPEQREQALVYLGSLKYVMNDYRGAIDAFEDYFGVAREPAANVHLRAGTAYYFLEEYANAIPHIVRHIDILQQENEPVPKSSFDLLRTLYLSTGDTGAAVEILEESLAAYDDEENAELLRELTDVAQGRTNQASSSLRIDQGQPQFQVPRVAASDSEMLPIVVIRPEYPASALNRKVEGWVLAEFTVNEAGEVEDPEIVDAEPPGIFDESALRAVAQFRFNPRIVDNQPVSVSGVRYLFRYNPTR